MVTTARSFSAVRAAVSKGITTVFINGTDVTAYVRNSTLNLKLNSCDFTLVDSAVIPALGDTVNVMDPTWVGSVTSFQTTDNDKSGHKWIRVTATNNSEATASAAPFGLVDTAGDFRNLSITKTLHDGDTEVRGELETFKAGLYPGMTFNLTSATHGLVAYNFTIQDVEIEWLKRTKPLYKITFGDAIVTMSVWVNSETEAALDNIFPIDETRITDGAVTTPKLAANAVTAEKIGVGEITADKLAATLILASLIKTQDSGTRIEVDSEGIRAYSDDETLLVKIPTDGSAVYVNGEILASTLTVTGMSEFRGANSFRGSSVTTLEAGVTEPTQAPTLSSTIDSLSLGTTPSHPGYGISHDSTAGTFWIGGDPASSTDVGYEYNATTGALVRTLTKSSDPIVTTKTLGSTSHVTDGAHWSGANTENQVAYGLTMPENGNITQVGAWLAGKDSSAAVKLCVWNSSGTLLGQSASFSATGKSFALGASVQYTKSLTTPVAATSGTTYYVGWSRDPDDSVQYDRDDNASVSYRVDDATGTWPASLSGYSTINDTKPNVYLKYTVTTDVSTEGTMGKIVGIARAGSYVWALDENEQLFQYNQSTLAYIGKFDMSSRIQNGSRAGMFYDGTNLIITTTSTTSASAQVRFVKLNASTGAWVSNLDATGLTIHGTDAITRAGGKAVESNTYYWVAITDTTTPVTQGVYAFNTSTGATIANTVFGTSADMSNGVTHNGTQFYGWVASTPTKIWKYSTWNWTTSTSKYYVAYSWYDSAGTTHETDVSPTTSVTMGRRRNLLVTTPGIPTGGADDPDKVRIYMLQSATEPTSGSMWLQVTDALTARTITTYASSGTHDSAGTAFPSSTSAEIKSATSGWSLKGDGTASFGSVDIGSGSLMRFVRTPNGGTAVVNGVAGQTTTQTTAELTDIPVNGAVYGEFVFGIRHSVAGANEFATIMDYDGTTAAFGYNSGSASRGGWHTGVMVKLGGTNNRQIKWKTSDTTNVTFFLYLVGYWTDV